jgi:hypothetical protein
MVEGTTKVWNMTLEKQLTRIGSKTSTEHCSAIWREGKSLADNTDQWIQRNGR